MRRMKLRIGRTILFQRLTYLPVTTGCLPVGLRFGRFSRGEWNPWDGATSFVSLSEALARFVQARRDLRPKTLRSYQQAVQLVIDRAGKDTGISGLDARDIRPIVSDPRLTQSSRLSYFQRLAAFFNWCVKQGLAESSPMSRVERPRTPDLLPNGLTAPELDRLLTAASAYPWARDAFALIAWTGLRPSEAARLKWSEVSEHDLRVVGVTKTMRERSVTIIPQARAVLDELPRTNHRVLNGHQGGPVSVEYLSKVFGRCRDLAKLPERFTLYSLRHTFAAEYVRRGGSIRLLKDEMGHASVTTTEKYGHLSPKDRRRLTLEVFND